MSTSTASGKSLCYNLPVIEAIAANRNASAIYVFPTKALAQDQLRALREFLAAAFPRDTPIADVYDGDTEHVRPVFLLPLLSDVIFLPQEKAKIDCDSEEWKAV